MKTIKKIFWFIILIFVLYIILIFVKPAFADQIADLLWIKSFNEKIRIIKNWIDVLSTKIPSEEEITDWINTTKEKIEDVKDTINDIRETTKDLKEKYEETKEFIDETKEKIDTVKDKLNDLEEIWEGITNLVNTWAIE